MNAQCHCTGCETINDFSNGNFADKVIFFFKFEIQIMKRIFLFNLPSQAIVFD